MLKTILMSHARLIQRNEAYSCSNIVCNFGIPEVPDNNPESLVLDLFKLEFRLLTRTEPLLLKLVHGGKSKKSYSKNTKTRNSKLLMRAENYYSASEITQPLKRNT